MWAVAVWGYFGAAVTRASAYELATRERLGLAASLKARCQWLAILLRQHRPAAGVGILMVTLLTCLPCLPLASKYLVWLSGIVWPLVLAGGSVLAVLALGLFFGWPIMWGSLGVERPDSFDAIGRGIPIHLSAALALPLLRGRRGRIGRIGLDRGARTFVAVIVGLSWWAASWVGTAERVRAACGRAAGERLDQRRGDR